jgi:hypothetical protein
MYNEMYRHVVARLFEALCTTSCKVVDSIPDGVTRIFHGLNLYGHTMALGSTQPLTEMITRNISWGIEVAGA